MKSRILVAAVCVMVPAGAFAQSADEGSFSGMKVGVSADYRSHEAEYPLTRIGTTIDRDRAGFGYRAHAGFDMELGHMLVIGAEAGLGRGGKRLRAKSATGEYSLTPGWSWDVSGRAGILPANNILVYGRAGYSWLRVREKTDFVATATKDIRTGATESGFLYGGGIETAIAPGFFVRAEYNRVNYRDGLRASRTQLGMAISL
ncbi:MAG: outer membrane protein [Sphingobium sp.]